MRFYGYQGQVMSRPSYSEAIERSGVIAVLAEFDPHVAGTPPLGLDLPGSDIDILCEALEPERFAAVAWRAFSHLPGFGLHQWAKEGGPVIARFHAEGWDFELFASADAVAAQPGWRHFLVERRLLALGGERMRAGVMAMRQGGMKTEPAFARLLGLEGDPYIALLELELVSDDALIDLIARALQ